MKTEKYTDKAGIEKYTTKIIVNEMQMLGSRCDTSRVDSDTSRASGAKAEARPASHAASFDNFDDDIPF